MDHLVSDLESESEEKVNEEPKKRQRGKFEWAGYSDIKKNLKKKKDVDRKRKSRKESKEAGISGTRVKHFTKVDGSRVKRNMQLNKNARKEVSSKTQVTFLNSQQENVEHAVELLWNDDGCGKFLLI